MRNLETYAQDIVAHSSDGGSFRPTIRVTRQDNGGFGEPTLRAPVCSSASVAVIVAKFPVWEDQFDPSGKLHSERVEYPGRFTE